MMAIQTIDTADSVSKLLSVLSPILIGSGETTTKTSSPPASTAALQSIIAQLTGGSGDYSKNAAISDSTGPVADLVMKALQAQLPEISNADKIAGAYNSPTTQMLTNDLVARTSAAGQQAIQDNIMNYAKIQAAQAQTATQAAAALQNGSKKVTSQTAPAISPVASIGTALATTLGKKIIDKTGIFDKIASAVTGGDVASTASNVASSFSSQIGLAGSDFASSIDPVTSFAGANLSSGIDAGNSLFSFGTDSGSFSNIFGGDSGASDFMPYVGPVLDAANGNFGGAAGTLVGSFVGGPVGGAIGNFVGSNLEPIVSTVGDVASGVASGIGDVAGGIGDAVGGIVDAVSGGSVICTELNRQGLLSDELLAKDTAYARANLSPTVMLGYHTWAIPYVRIMRRSPAITRLTMLYALPFCKTVSGVSPTLWGKTVLAVGKPICWAIGAARILISDLINELEIEHG